MNLYEVERKLNDKVDSWRFFSLEGEVNTLKHGNLQLTGDLRELQAAYNNQTEILRQLIDLVNEHIGASGDDNLSDRLQNLKQQL